MKHSNQHAALIERFSTASNFFVNFLVSCENSEILTDEEKATIDSFLDFLQGTEDRLIDLAFKQDSWSRRAGGQS